STRLSELELSRRQTGTHRRGLAVSLDNYRSLHVGGVDIAEVIVSSWNRKGEAPALPAANQKCGAPEGHRSGRVDHRVSGDGRILVSPDDCVVNVDYHDYRRWLKDEILV